MYNNGLMHSAKGSSWTKKDHKYIRKEGNRYIYPEDLASSKGKGLTGIFSKKKKAKAMNAKLDEEEKKRAANKRLDEYEAKKGIPGQASENARRTQEMQNDLRAKAKKRMDDRERELYYENKRKDAQKQLDNLNRANKNLLNSPNGKTARDIIKENGVTKVERNKEGLKETRSVTRKTSDGRREVTDTQVVQNSVNHPGGTARDMISRKGTRRIQYNDTSNGRTRTVTNRDYRKSREKVEKWVGNPDNRSKFQKKASQMKRSVARGKAIVSALLQTNKSAYDSQIPLSMRIKRDLKKARKKG